MIIKKSRIAKKKHLQSTDLQSTDLQSTDLQSTTRNRAMIIKKAELQRRNIYKVRLEIEL